MIDKPIRFCMVTTFYPPYNFGGDGIFAYHLSNELAQRGHCVDVIHNIDAYNFFAKKRPLKLYNNHPNITVHGIKGGAGVFSLLLTHQLGRLVFQEKRVRDILQKRFDVIHFHNISLMGGPKILKFGKAIKLYTLHEYWLICQTHTMLKYCKSPCRNRNCFLCALLHKRPPQLWRYSERIKEAIKLVDRFIAPSRFIQKIHYENYPQMPIAYIPNFTPAIDATLRNIYKPLNKDQTPYFLFVGRLEKNKGLQTLIPVFREYKKANLLVAGTGSYEKKLKLLAQDCKNIIFLGHLDSVQLKRRYQNSVAVIMPSIWFENMPLVIAEAFSNRTPVIARNLGSMKEIIDESGGGLVYETEKELIAGMEILLVNASMRRDMCLSGYRTFKENWTPEIYLAKYFQTIESLNKVKANAIKTSMQ
jgi:glycosyltransferase involved in cell wall biosynthesis